MKHRIIPTWVVVAGAALCLLGPTGLSAQVSPIDDLIKRAQNAFNDLNYPQADSIAKQVLAIGRISNAQRTSALMVIAAAAYPEEASAQRRGVALATLKQIVKTNFDVKMPQELTWPGLDSLVAEAKRTTFALQITGEPSQTIIGPTGLGKIHVKSNKPGMFRISIAGVNGGPVAVIDSAGPVAEGDITFRVMRDDKPQFVTGDYSMIVIGFDPAGRDTVTSTITVKAEAAPLTFAPIPTKMDSTRLLKERAGKFGAKAIVPALIVGGAAFAFSNVLRGEGNISSAVAADGKGVAVGGALAVSTIIAGFMDKGRVIPENIAANLAAGAAFQKSIVDVQAENRRRITEFKTVLTFDLEAK